MGGRVWRRAARVLSGVVAAALLYGSACTVGTASHGAVLYTASEAALRGLTVIIPMDGISTDNTYAEQYTA